jgi:iron(III) transport system permease protein
VGYLVVPPLVVLLYGSLTDTPPMAPPHFTFDTLKSAFSDTRIYSSLANSVAYGTLVATSVLILGGFLAWVVERTDSRARQIADLFTLAPMLVPAVVMVSGWILLLSPRAGLINMIWAELGFSQPLFNIYSFWGMVWVGTLQELPLAFLWLWPILHSMNPELEEAARASGAGPFTTFRRITLRMLRPTLLITWIVFFIYAISALSVPILIGIPGGVIFYATEIYLSASGLTSNLNLASAYSLLFLVMSLAGVYAYQRALSDASRFATIRGKAYRPRRIALGAWGPFVTGFTILLLVLIAGLPLLVLVWTAFMPYPQIPSARSLQLFTFRNFERAFSYGPAERAIVNSLLLAAAAGLLTTVLGVAIAWSSLRLRAHKSLTSMIDQLAMAPLAIPAVVLGVGLMWVYLLVPLHIYATLWILLIAYITIHLPFAVRICIGGMAQIDREMEEAGSAAGAGRLQTFRRITMRLLAPSIATSVIYVGLRSFREYGASIFLVAPGTEVFAVLVLTLWEGGAANEVAAYATCVMLLLFVIAIGLNWIARRFGLQLQHG